MKYEITLLRTEEVVLELGQPRVRRLACRFVIASRHTLHRGPAFGRGRPVGAQSLHPVARHHGSTCGLEVVAYIVMARRSCWRGRPAADGVLQRQFAQLQLTG